MVISLSHLAIIQLPIMIHKLKSILKPYCLTVASMSEQVYITYNLNVHLTKIDGAALNVEVLLC